ncbi:MAG: hypothetical protein ACPLYF_02830 [Fervidobacterium sp.]
MIKVVKLREKEMLKKAFIGVLFVGAFLLTLLIVGINFNVTKAVDYGSPGTPVGGIIWKNTTWTLENSPYIITDTVQIPENVTLTIEPGVVVTKPTAGDMFLVHGTIYAHGTPDNRITFDGGGNSNFFSAEGSEKDAFLDLEYCVIKDGISFWPPTGYSQYGHFILRHSKLVNIASYSYVWYPPRDVYIEYNTFINTAGFSIGHSSSSVYIRYNLFKGNRGVLVENWASYSGETVVQYNSFVDMAGTVLALPPGYSSAAMIATENYWGTTDTKVIDSMIYDKNDDIRCAGFIEYLPILTEPHPDTPILLEDVKVNINGVFRKDDDGKWRCYANITIINNSYRNVTLRWIYLKAINITYIDETFEELDISGNETLNYVIQPEQELSLSWTVTEYGFTKEPKILWVLLQTPILEAYGTITLTTVITEFPSISALLMLILSTLVIILAKRRMANI